MNTVARSGTTVSVLSVLENEVVDVHGNALGALEDIVARLRDDDYPQITGLLVKMDGARVLVPAHDGVTFLPNRVQVMAHSEASGVFKQGQSDILLKEDVLERRVVDLDRVALVRANDIQLASTADGWTVTGLDVHRHRWFQFGAREQLPVRDWHAFLPIGQQGTPDDFGGSSGIRRLKPAQIADLIESASAEERESLLAQVRADPDLEADVFEELDDNRQAQLLRVRNDNEVADVLSRMRADDAADAIMELPQERRLKVLELLPQPHGAKVLTLLGYNEATAGGLMGTDYLALSGEHSIAEALEKIKKATTQQPEALTTIYTLNSDGTLAGTLGIIRALQLDPATRLRDAADPDAVVAAPEDDLIAITTRMADFNLLNLPVVDADRRILGIITVDDALEAAIPSDWSRREPGHPKSTVRSRRA